MNCFKAKIYKMKESSRCRFCGDKDETTNLMISECSKLAPKEYKARDDRVGEVIYWILCQRFKFDHRIYFFL